MNYKAGPLSNVLGICGVSVLFTSVFVGCSSSAVVSAKRIGGFDERVITTGTLLEEMIDRDAVARFPEPRYFCSQFSSYDRAAKSPDENWFANGDANQFLRIEKHGDRDEWVMMDAKGPGAIVRFWSANPPNGGLVRVYLDGSDAATITVPMTELLNGTWRIPKPMSEVRSRGWNLYFPIAYARECKITCDKPGFYYQINYRTYERGTKVRSFRENDLDIYADEVKRARDALNHPGADSVEKIVRASGKLDSGEEMTMPFSVGSQAIRSMQLRIEADDFDSVLRSTVIAISFDGEQSVWCPVGDFFGSGIGLNSFSGWWRTVAEEPNGTGVLTSRWVMPFQEGADVRIHNLSNETVHVELEIGTGKWKWDNRSMHFHARWRQEDPLPTRPMRDWNYVAVKGQGVYVGDVLSVVNPVKNWWGEGDEKIYVDGENFPSHFGTGTEDYYGYAWGSTEPFWGPFHAQPRCDGPANFGHTTVTRGRTLDAIPFTTNFRFDMEVWHWADCKIGYAATSYYYALLGAVDNRRPQPEEARRGTLDPPPLPPPFRIEGATEAEGLKILKKSEGVEAEPQGGFGDQLWSGGRQLWVRAHQVGDFVELAIPVEGGAGTKKVVVYGTKSWDYGVVRFILNETSAGDDVDLFNTKGRAVVPTGAIDLGTAEVKDGRIVLRIEVVGSNDRSEKPGTYFGIDCMVLTDG